MAGWRKSNDIVHPDGIVEKGVSGRPSVPMDEKKLNRYLNEPPEKRISDAIKKRRASMSPMPSAAQSDRSKKRYEPKAVGVRP